MNPEENKAFTRLVTANGLAEADVWKAVLEASGIQVFLRHEAMAAVIPETAGEIARARPSGAPEPPAGALPSLPDGRATPAAEADRLYPPSSPPTCPRRRGWDPSCTSVR